VSPPPLEEYRGDSGDCSSTAVNVCIKQSDNPAPRFDIQFTSGDKTQLEFFHDGKKVDEAKDGVKITFANDVASLTIEKAREEHSGAYECIMKTKGGEARCKIGCRVTKKEEKKKA
jgi:hypothetical protein